MENTLENTRTLTLTFQELYGKIMLDQFDLSLDIDEDVQQLVLSELMTGPVRTVRCRGITPYEVTEGEEYLVAIKHFYEGKIRAKKPDTVDERFWSMIEASLEKMLDAKRIDLAIDFKELSN